MKDLNELLQAGVSLDTVLDASVRMTPLEAEQTDQALAAAGVRALSELVDAVPQNKEAATELIAETWERHSVHVGFAFRLQPSEVETLIFRLKSGMPYGTKGAIDGLVQAIKREARRQKQELKGRFASGGIDGADPATWDKLAKTDNGAPIQSFDNLCIVLEHDPKWAGRFAYCEFSDKCLLDGNSLSDKDTLQVRRWAEQAYGLRMSSNNVHEATVLISHNRPVHPVRDYLNSVEWDGIDRIDFMFSTWFGVEDNNLVRAYGRKFMISAVARIFEPGCKVDTMPILVGLQGSRKSSGFAALAHKWFRDSPIDMNSKDGFAVLSGSWIHEMPEIEALRRAREASTIKAFLSSREDVYRPAFGRHLREQPRQCVFVGTDNAEGPFLKDPTGSRRFWVMKVVEGVDVEGLEANRDQLWAEAVHRYRAGERWWLDEYETGLQREENRRWEEPDYWTEALNNYIDAREDDAMPGEEVLIRTEHAVQEALGIPAERARGKPNNAAVRVLTERGYVRRRRARLGKWFYVKLMEGG